MTDQNAQALAQIQQALTLIAPQQWKFTEPLPVLTKGNFDAWKCTLNNVFREHDLLVLLSDTFDVNNYTGTEQSTMEKASASCARMISAYIHPDILQLLPGTTFSQTPNKILKTLKTLLKKDNALVHSILKAEAKALKMQDSDSIGDYVEKHMTIRARMISASYPDITDINISAISRNPTPSARLPESYPPRRPSSPRTTAFHHWHLVFNHLDLKTIQKMAKQQLSPLPDILCQPPPRLTCSGCANGKARPKPYKLSNHNYAIGVAVSSDVCGPISPISRHGNKYFVSFIDTASRYAIIYFTSTRKQVLQFISRTIALIRTLHGVAPQLLISDNAKEYISKQTSNLLSEHGITARSTTPYSPQQNGIAERLNATIMQAARANLYHSALPDTFWEDAVRDATFKYNISIHSSTKQIPYTLWFGSPSSLTSLFAFGQTGAVPVITDPTLKTKLSPRAFPARYMFAIDPQHVMVLNTTTGQYKKVRSCDFRPYQSLSDPVHTTASAFKCHLPPPDPVSITSTTPAPSSFKQARRYPDATSWAIAHNAELDKLDTEGAIRWLPDKNIPKSAKLIPLLMTYRYKRTPTGYLLECKARCALRGDLMIPRVHFNPDHTTAFMADKASVRLTLAIKAALGLQIDHFDIKSAFVQEEYHFDKPVYVRQHPRFDGSRKHQGKGGLLIKNIYGGPSRGFFYLRGAEEFLTSLGFHQCHSDPCLFIYVTNNRDFILITLNIDDFLVVATTAALINNLYTQLQRKYPNRVKRLGPPSQYLGWKIDYLPCRSVKISQPQYIAKALDACQMSDANGRPSPHVDGYKYHAPSDTDKKTPHLKQKFQSLLGELRYITYCTRPDIAYYVNKLASAAHDPTRRHWLILKNILRYLKQTINHGIVYRPFSAPPPKHKLSSFADAYFAGDHLDRKSTSGAVHLFNNSPIAWSSSKQSITALSTCEAEYVSATAAVQVTQWLRRMLCDIHMPPSHPTPLYLDNQAAITVATNTAPTKKRKCIDVRHHYLQDHLKKRTITISHVPSRSMLADILTKPLGATKFVNMKQSLNIIGDLPTLHESTIA